MTPSHVHWDTVHAAAREFEDIPMEAVFKEDMLRQGIWFDDQVLAPDSDYARKSYFIFSFDRTPLNEMDGAQRVQAPEEIRITGGEQGLSPFVVSVRLNPESPYVVSEKPGEQEAWEICLSGRPVGEVSFAPTPPYYGQSTADGTPLVEVAPSIEWGYLLYLTVFRMCQYFGHGEECQFCDINNNFRQQREDERIYNAVKPLDRVMEALEVVEQTRNSSLAYTLTGGSITSDLLGETETDYYVKYAEAIEARFPGRWIGKMVVQALPLDDVRRIADAGIRVYHPNYEIWDPKLFDVVCPGKARHVGRSEWIDRILASVELFDPYCVIPNFVAGVEMAAPHGFRTEEEAWASTGEGLEFFMSRGVLPRFTTWCPEPLSVLGQKNGPASLRYHVGLLDLYREIFERHSVPDPLGYGEVGLGRAVFSVSSFMDVLRPAAERTQTGGDS